MESHEKSRGLKHFAGIAISIATTLVIFKLTETTLTWSVIAQAKPELLLLAFLLRALFWLLWAL